MTNHWRNDYSPDRRVGAEYRKEIEEHKTDLHVEELVNLSGAIVGRDESTESGVASAWAERTSL
jgi:hypothetical protein